MPKPTSNQILNRSGVVGNTVTDALETLRTTGSFGDMYKAVYDTNNNGKVDVAEVAENVQWVNIYDKPFTFPPSAHSHTDATTADSGFMSASDKTKLDGVAPGATANDTDLNLKDRANHTGTQAISTVTGLQTALNGKQNTLVSGTTIKTINGDSLLGSGNLVISGGGGGGSIATDIHAATSKTTPVDADELGLSDSAASWGLKKLTWANLKATLLAYFKEQFREKLTAPRTYYVRTDGSDSNDGLTNTSGGAFLTTQKAIDAASALDNGGHNITIQHGPGTHTGSAVAKTFVGSGTVILMGDLSTPANCSWVVPAGVVFSIPDGVIGEYLIQGFSIAANANVCMAVGRGGTLKFSNLEFGASIGHIAANGGLCRAVGNYAIKGGAVYHATAAYNGSIQIFGVTVTLTGTPAFSLCFARAEVASTISAYSNTFSGSATGTRYIVADNSVIFVNGAGATYLPGNAAGTNDGTGVYR